MAQDHTQRAVLLRLEVTETRMRELAVLVPCFSDPVQRAESRTMLESTKEEAEAMRRELDQLAKGAAGKPALLYWRAGEGSGRSSTPISLS
jgi:hypothetical protein